MSNWEETEGTEDAQPAAETERLQGLLDSALASLREERRLRGLDVTDRVAAEITRDQALADADRLRTELDAARVTIRALVGQARPDDDPQRAIWDAEQRAELLRRQIEDAANDREEDEAQIRDLNAEVEQLHHQVAELTDERDAIADHAADVTTEAAARGAELDEARAEVERLRGSARHALIEVADRLAGEDVPTQDGCVRFVRDVAEEYPGGVHSGQAEWEAEAERLRGLLTETLGNLTGVQDLITLLPGDGAAKRTIAKCTADSIARIEREEGLK